MIRDLHSYGVADICAFFEDKDIATLILINPDNPSGNYIPKDELLGLVKWCKDKGIRIVVDESFADFADEEDNTLIRQDILEEYDNLYVMKSISKSYGIPGLRLGVLASGDTEAIARIKKDVSIWNINSFAEFYMQIAEKYKKDYAKALATFKTERARFYEGLSVIPSIRVIPSSANYFMIEILDGKQVEDVTKTLLAKYNILVKDLSPKFGGKEYMRTAIRDREDNDRLTAALLEVLAGRKA